MIHPSEHQCIKLVHQALNTLAFSPKAQTAWARSFKISFEFSSKRPPLSSGSVRFSLKREFEWREFAWREFNSLRPNESGSHWSSSRLNFVDSPQESEIRIRSPVSLSYWTFSYSSRRGLNVSNGCQWTAPSLEVTREMGQQCGFRDLEPILNQDSWWSKKSRRSDDQSPLRTQRAIFNEDVFEFWIAFRRWSVALRRESLEHALISSRNWRHRLSIAMSVH